MGGYKKFHKAVTKVIDPFNLVDPLNVLPTSWMAGKKPFTFDKDYGKLQWNLGSPAGSYSPMTKGLSNDPKYFAQQQQMVADMQLKNQANQLKQQAQLSNLRSQLPLYPANVATTQSVETEKTPASTSATVLAQSGSGDTTSSADMPTELLYKPTASQTPIVAANTFQMPDMSSIKFGGA